VADHLADVSAAAGLDLADLYRRVVFSVAIHNTDDHLRNLSLLHEPGGWRLAPVFDVNPNPERRSLRVTGIAGATERVDEQAGLAELAARCRLTIQEAEAIRRDVDAAVSTWPAVARRHELGQAEIHRFETAFKPTAP
jgi:serine/threonine-protein kinase HipA